MTIDEKIWVGVGVVLFVLMVIAIVGYLCNCLIRYRILKLFRPCSPIIGFIPFVGQYMVGKCCNGKDGQNTGIFNMRLSNLFWNWGWASYFACFVCFMILNYVTDGSPVFAKLFVSFAQVMSFLYWSSLYAFLYSRIEGRPENEVRVLAILSAVIGIVGFVKVLTIGVTQVYSLPNDIYPVETYTSYPSGEDYGEEQYDGQHSFTQDEIDFMK